MDMNKMPRGMDYSKMNKAHDVHIGMSEHDHHAMMIADFKKRFYVVLVLTVIKFKL
jgi:Cu2+-exporting ATPase